jgi:subtilisin family serine protease
MKRGLQSVAGFGLVVLLLLGGCDQASMTDALNERETASVEAYAPSAQVDGDIIPGWYIVTLRDRSGNVEARARELVGAHGGEIRHLYRHTIRGFSARLSDQAVEALRRNPNVVDIERDQVVRAFGSGQQSNATWGLDRVDQRALPLNGLYQYETAASNVNAYILDTGIRFSHNDFGGRVQSACFDAFGGNCNDGNGHGTHVAGTVGGTVYGIAKSVKLYAVRVLDNQGSGTMSGVIAGVDWVTANHEKPAVANMSLGGGASSALDDAVRESINAGITYAVAAGNGDRLGRQQPACNYSPARVREALTVGASTTTDSKTSWSNYGECVDIFAPGASITSTWHTSNTATNTISGTSMAAPHVAGAAALYLANNPGASTSQVFQAIFDNSTKNVVTNSSSSNNHLLYTLWGEGGGTNPGDPVEDPTEPEDPSEDDITLSGNSFKVRGVLSVELSWSGQSSSHVDVLYNGSYLTTRSGSSWTHETGLRGGGSVTYKVCEAGTSVCSSQITVAY